MIQRIKRLTMSHKRNADHRMLWLAQAEQMARLTNASDLCLLQCSALQRASGVACRVAPSLSVYMFARGSTRRQSPRDMVYRISQEKGQLSTPIRGAKKCAKQPSGRLCPLGGSFSCVQHQHECENPYSHKYDIHTAGYARRCAKNKFT